MSTVHVPHDKVGHVPGKEHTWKGKQNLKVSDLPVTKKQQKELIAASQGGAGETYTTVERYNASHLVGADRR